MSFLKEYLKRKSKVCLLLAGMLLSISIHAQQITVTGTVFDPFGESLPGVNVLIKGTDRGVATDINGKYTLNVPNEKTILQFSYIGFNTLEVTVGAQRSLDVTLEESASSLNEVVVIGYSSQVRANLTGAVGSVSGATLERIPVISAAEALAGKIAGVQVTTMDGEPGAEVHIRIRGGTSVTQSNDPLYIVDGFPQSNINDIPPTDILSIDILKDGALTAIYGARGSNGVVLVTTKSAQAGTVKVNFNHYTKINTLARKIDVMDAYDFVNLQYDFAVRSNNDRRKFVGNFGHGTDIPLYKRIQSNDWQNEILGNNPMSQMYNLSIGGGSQKISFTSAITYNDDNGVLVGSGVKKVSVNTKVKIEINPKLKVLLNPKLNYSGSRGAGSGAVGRGGIIDVLRYRPTNGLRDFSFYDPTDINPDEEEYFVYTNPKNDIEQNYRRENTNAFINQATIEWTPIKNLIIKSEGSITFSMTDLNRFWGYITDEGRRNNNLPLAEITHTKRNAYHWTNTANYSFSKDKHTFSFLLGHEMDETYRRIVRTAARYFPKSISPNKALQNMGLGSPMSSVGSSPASMITAPNRLVSFFGQVHYIYDSKYILQFTMRGDGSTRFAPGNQWGYFPGISGGWVISDEKFMPKQDIVSYLKLRFSIALTGNNGIDDDMWRYQFAIASGNGPGWGERSEYGETYYVSAGGNIFPNTKLKWESCLKRSLGMDMRFFNDRLEITPEIFWYSTSDLLFRSNINPTTGYVRQFQNIADVTGKGWDLTVIGTVLQKKNVYLKGNLTFGAVKKIVDRLNGTETEMWLSHNSWASSNYDYVLKAGGQVGMIYGYVYDGIYGFDEFTFTNRNEYIPLPNTTVCSDNILFGTQPGRPKFKNFVDYIDGEDDVNIVNDNDKIIIGNTNPKFNGGFGFQGMYKLMGKHEFDFSCNFNFMYGFDVNNATRYTLSSLERNENNYFNCLPEFNETRRWRYANELGERLTGSSRLAPEYREINANAAIFNPCDIGKKVTFDYFIEDGSFLRLQDLTIGYTLPKTISNKIAMERLRVYLSGYNLFLLTGYSGYDPEVDVQTGLACGMDYNRYPRARSFLMGINLTF